MVNSNISAIVPGTWKLMPEVPVKPSYSWIFSYEYLWGDRLSLILQNQIHSSFVQREIHPEISKPIFEWTAGLKFDASDGFRFTIAVTENYIYHNNTADFGFHLGLSREF